jgi:hypothetical protein
MSLKLAGMLFTGPFPVDTTEVRANHVPIIFAIIAKGGQSWAPVFRVIDIGLSPDGGMRFGDHPRRAEWQSVSDGPISVYTMATPRSAFPAAERERLVDELRRQYDPPRGTVE